MAQQFGDVVAVELLCIAGEEGWGIPVRVREETLLRQVAPGEWCPPISAQTSSCNPSGLEPACQGLSERVETIAVDRQVEWASFAIPLGGRVGNRLYFAQ